MRSHFLVAATHSGAGKTTVTLGLLGAFQRQGLRVQPFKCGPDYIDPIHHRTAAGRDSINLDGFMMSPGHISQLYARYSAEADVCITEGVMGLFDGSRKNQGSSASLAISLGLPVILVLHAKAIAYSAAAILFGLKNFDLRLRIAGVIFNFVDPPSHYRLLQEAGEDVGITALGHLPANNALRIPSRHLGLDSANADEAIEAAASHLAHHLDLNTLLTATQVSDTAVPDPTPVSAPASFPTVFAGSSAPIPPPPAAVLARPDVLAKPRSILIARDAAFHFLYPENINQLKHHGRISFFSPLHDTRLPAADLLYLPGGYPELYLERLSANKTLLQDIRDFAANGGKIIAECGGMMVLGNSITDANGNAWPMTGLLDIATSIEKKKLTLGYRRVQWKDYTVNGHEFHYSQLIPSPAATTDPAICATNWPNADPTSAPLISNSQDLPVDTPIFLQPNLLATYMHFYWGEDDRFLQQWLD